MLAGYSVAKFLGAATDTHSLLSGSGSHRLSSSSGFRLSVNRSSIRAHHSNQLFFELHELCQTIDEGIALSCPRLRGSRSSSPAAQGLRQTCHPSHRQCKRVGAPMHQSQQVQADALSYPIHPVVTPSARHTELPQGRQ